MLTKQASKKKGRLNKDDTLASARIKYDVLWSDLRLPVAP